MSAKSSELTTSNLEREGGGVAFNYPLENDYVAETNPTTPACSPAQKVLPKRLRKRLLEMSKSKSPSTVEEIDVKLKEADLRRKQYYESLSNKARSVPRNPSCFSLPEEVLGQRLEAKLKAAEQKRLNILAKEQMRLAGLNKLHETAKSGAVLRFEQERDKLSMKIESRVQRAEEKQSLFLKAFRQQRAAKKERVTQSLIQRTTQERKYKECVRAAIHQKRIAAEEKRLGLLEAKKSRVHAKVLQARHIANSISSQGEIKTTKMKDQLEDRLRRAKRQREEHLRQRGSLNASRHNNSQMMQEPVNLLGKKLLRCWKMFLQLKGTTSSLAKAHEALGLNEASIKSMSFELLAIKIESPKTILVVRALFDRFESYCTHIQRDADFNDIDHLLKHVFSPSPGDKMVNIPQRRGKTKVGSVDGATNNSIKLSRYPVRVVLCAYMILGHPDAVFSGTGEREDALAESAATFIRQFELLVQIVLYGPNQTTEENATLSVPRRSTFRSQLEAFDKSWCSYLCCFVVWKAKDAKLLEEDLVRAACQLEISLIRTFQMAPKGVKSGSIDGMKAFQKQVMEDIKFIREKVQQLCGIAGLQHMESALSDARSKLLEAKQNKASSQSTINVMPGASNSGSVSASGGLRSTAEGHETSGLATCAVLKEHASQPDNEVSSTDPSEITTKEKLSFDSVLGSENELLVNEIVHARRHGITDSLSARYVDHNSTQEKVRETMEKAFWDGITETIQQDDPDYSWVLKLMKEVRDELCEMSPSSWKQEIVETLNSDTLSEVLSSGNVDIDYLGKVLTFALVTLQKLSAPANDDKITTTHHDLLEELGVLSQGGNKSNASFSHSMIKGLRFVLQQIQILKREISRARIKMIEPLIKSPAGLDYLRKAFSSRYGSPSEAPTTLQLTKQWFASVSAEAEQEWDDYTASVSALTPNNLISSLGLPAITLRTGGSLSSVPKMGVPTSTSTGIEQPGCRGERVDLLVRLGLSKLANKVMGLTVETLPETLKLNAFRLRAVQSQIQKIIVISTSMLILRQTLISENLTSPADIENLVTKCTKHLSELDNVEDVSVPEIFERINGLLADDNNVLSPEKLQTRKEIMANMLAKSLQAGDPIFTKVSHTIYLAVRGVMLGGSGDKGRQIAEMILRRVASVPLTEKVAEAAEVLAVMATVSVTVHGAWYQELLKSL